MNAQRSQHRPAGYDELIGDLDAKPRRPAGCDLIVYSDLMRGAGTSGGFRGISFKYVARGAVHHRFGGRSYSVREGQFLFVPEGLASEIEVMPTGEGSTVGLCLFFAGGEEPCRTSAPAIDEPLVFSAKCSTLGELLIRETVKLKRSLNGREARARVLLQSVAANLEPLLEEAAGQLASIDAVKSSTRYETVRRLNRARGYLHDVTDRAVPLEELARVAGISRFQLLRGFRQCFGFPPATYHRRLRLDLAVTEIGEQRLSCAMAAERFGFADASSFSHACRRVYARSPTRAKGQGGG